MPDLIPDKYAFPHEFCLALYDGMVRLLRHGDKEGAFSVRFTHSDRDRVIALCGEDDVDVLGWLEREGRQDILEEVLFRSLFPALLSDFCQFVYEALSCSRRCKLGASFVLLRKALLEDLMYMEWLVAQPDEMVATFWQGDPHALDRSEHPKAARVASIAEALVRTGLSEAFTPDLMFEVRYGTSPNTFTSLGNQAMHLVTTRNPANRTLEQNFNFIFSRNDDHTSQWSHLYSMLPGQLFYAAELSELLMSAVLDGPMPDQANEARRRYLGFALYADWLESQGDAGESVNPLEAVKLACSNCGSLLPIDRATLERLFYGESIACRSCGSAQSVDSVKEAL